MDVAVSTFCPRTCLLICVSTAAILHPVARHDTAANLLAYFPGGVRNRMTFDVLSLKKTYLYCAAFLSFFFFNAVCSALPVLVLPVATCAQRGAGAEAARLFPS